MFGAPRHYKLLSTLRRFLSITWTLAFSLYLFGCVGSTTLTPVAPTSLALSASSFDFKTVVLGQTVTKSLRITNPGTTPLRISALSLPDNQFVFTGPSVPRVLLPNLYLDYTLAFTPTGAGSASASLVIQSNASDSLASVSLSGIGEKIISSLRVSPSALNFGNLPLQTTSAQNVTLQNAGDVNLTISGITVVGAGFGYSDLSPGYSLPPNQQVTFQVWFKPQVKGVASGTVSILSANLASPASLLVSGDGVAPSSPNPPPPTPPSPPPPTPPSPPSPPPAPPPPPPPNQPSPPPPVQHTVHLNWDASTSSVVGYRVYRAISSSGPFGIISTGTVAATDYDDSTVSSGTSYYYQVTALDSSGEESAASNVATAVIPSP